MKDLTEKLTITTTTMYPILLVALVTLATTGLLLTGLTTTTTKHITTTTDSILKSIIKRVDNMFLTKKDLFIRRLSKMKNFALMATIVLTTIIYLTFVFTAFN